MTHYERLGVARTASCEEIKRAFRTKAKQAHPDTTAHSSEARERSASELHQLVEARRVLIDRESRVAYDRLLDLGPRSPGRAQDYQTASPESGDVEQYCDGPAISPINAPPFRTLILLIPFLAILLSCIFSVGVTVQNLWNGNWSWRNMYSCIYALPLLGTVAWLLCRRPVGMSLHGALSLLFSDSARPERGRRKRSLSSHLSDRGYMLAFASFLLLSFGGIILIIVSDKYEGRLSWAGAFVLAVSFMGLVWLGRRASR